MDKLQSIGQLEWLRNKIIARSGEGKTRVYVCMTGCRAYGAASVREAIEQEVKSRRLDHQVEVRATGCGRSALYMEPVPVGGLET